jgi:isopropylmalate/homocitrate/citramalate synthase
MERTQAQQTPENQPKKFGPADWNRLSRKEVEREAQEIIRNARQKAAQGMEDLIEPLEAEFVADMKELSTKTKLGCEKATEAYLAGEGDTEYKRHMKRLYGQMKAILRDKSNPQAAAELRATLEEEYTNATMSEWDKHQIAKLLRK